MPKLHLHLFCSRTFKEILSLVGNSAQDAQVRNLAGISAEDPINKYLGRKIEAQAQTLANMYHIGTCVMS